MRRVVVLALAGVLGLLAFPTPFLPAATAADPSLVTTPSTKSVAWTDQNPRHPDDAKPEVRDALKDWRVRVTQTDELLNQTVQVTWEGGSATGNATFLQLMQCWSDSPNVSPTREQCAFGGGELTGADANSGSARTRKLDSDPREHTYRNDGGLRPVTVDGDTPGASWSGSSEVVFGTTAGRTCGSGTTRYDVRLTPAPGTPGEARLVQGPDHGVPPSVTRVANGFTVTFGATTAPVTFDTFATQPGLYRLVMSCLDSSDVLQTAFLGWVTKSSASQLWSMSTRQGGIYAPFDPLGEGPELAPTDPFEREQVYEYLKPRSTNEIWAARNNPAGGGEAFMEVQTDLEAQHLGCGRVESTGPRSCWLVVVPRWAPEPDGSQPETSTLVSPLSQTLWDRRIEVPLRFAPVAAGCKIGSGLKQILSDDAALAALRSWQPTYCADSSTAASVLGPLQDFSIRAGLSRPNRMGVVGVPDEGMPTLVVAPVATSAVVLAFSVDRQIPYGAPDYALDGTRTTELNLNPRLLAKLLSQSYDTGASPNGGKESGFNGSVYSSGFHAVFTPARNFPKNNPRTLYQDPEFLALNPDFASWLKQGAATPDSEMGDVLVAAADTDATQVLWRWILHDNDAKAFLHGSPDPHGMLINPYYKDQLTAETSSFPMLDPTCVDNLEDKIYDSFPLLCQINMHPRVESDAAAAQAAVRGDTKRVNTISAVTGEAGSYKPAPRQGEGRRAMLVLTNSAVAARYGLPTARLRNADGSFVAATTASITSARNQMEARRDGVLLPRPEKVGGTGYPLTTMSYAAVDVAATTQAQNNAFASMLSYAAGPGQTPGTAVGLLPFGYAPLSAGLMAQTVKAVDLLKDPSSLLAKPTPTPTPTTTEGTEADPSTASPVAPATGAPEQAQSPSTGPSGPAPTVGGPSPPRIASATAASAGATASVPWLLPGLLVAAILSLIAGRASRLLGAGRPLFSGTSGAGGSTATTAST